MKELNDTFSALELQVTAFEENFIKGRKRGANFADLVNALVNPNDEEEIQIVAQACLSVLKRRIDILGKAIRLVADEKPKYKTQIEPLCEGDF